jgi:hypothetical protein
MKMDRITNLLPAEMMGLARFCGAAMTIINARLFTLLGALLAWALFGWVLWQPDWIRFAGACAFALMVFLPLQRMEHRRIIKEEEAPQ